MQVKDSKVKSEPPNIVLPCFFYLTIIKEFTYFVFFSIRILVLLLELKKIYLFEKLLAKLFNFFSNM